MNYNSSCMFLCGRSNTDRDQFIPSIPKSNTTITEEEVEKIRANDLMHLSDIERERLFHDIQGTMVGSLVNETSQLIQDSLQELEYELVQLSRNTAYEQAIQMSSNNNNNNNNSSTSSLSCVKSYKFRLMFLRAESFEPRKAARRLISFLEEKLSLFGPEKLNSDITLDDMEQEDIEVLQCGCLQATTGYDRAGRNIHFALPQLKPNHCSPDSLRRAYMYQCLRLANDENIQKRGTISIVYMVDQPDTIMNDRYELWTMARIREAAPVRTSCQHLCYNNPTLLRVLNFVMPLFGPSARSRMTEHYGTHVEVLYKLMAFGIPPAAIPIDPSGKLRQELYSQWLPIQRALEARVANEMIDNNDNGINGQIADMELSDQLQFLLTNGSEANIEDIDINFPEPFDFIEEGKTDDDIKIDDKPMKETEDDDEEDDELILEPGRFDVVFGRGKGNQNRPGNTRFRHIIDMHMDKYETSNKYGKTDVSERVMRLIRESSGRFLKRAPNNGGWVEVDDPTEVRDKVSHAFRARRQAAKNSKASRTTTTPSPVSFRNMS